MELLSTQTVQEFAKPPECIDWDVLCVNTTWRVTTGRLVINADMHDDQAQLIADSHYLLIGVCNVLILIFTLCCWRKNVQLEIHESPQTRFYRFGLNNIAFMNSATFLSTVTTGRRLVNLYIYYNHMPFLHWTV